MNMEDLEKRVEAGIIYLHEGSMAHAQARADSNYMADWIKVEKARLMALFVGMSVTAAEAEALRHPAYLAALEAKKTADEIWFTAQFKRAAAETITEVWRTACSNARANV